MDFERYDRRAGLSPPLAADEVHLWLMELDAAAPARTVADAARERLGRLLGAYAGLAAAPAIVRGEHGKPSAPTAAPIEFNLSHSGPYALLAFASGQPLGVDIERAKRRLSAQEIAKRFFARAEADALARLPVERRDACFLDLWTRKEAVLKALGMGLQFGLDRLVFPIAIDGRVGPLEQIGAEAGVAGEWQVRELEPAPGLFGAIAWRGGARKIRAFRVAD